MSWEHIESIRDTFVYEVEFTNFSDFKIHKFVFNEMAVTTPTNTNTYHRDVVVDFSSSSTYGQTKNTTYYRGYSGSSSPWPHVFGYDAAQDVANGSDAAVFSQNQHNDIQADSSQAGEFILFDPLNTSLVKHFYGSAAGGWYPNYAGYAMSCGYVNTTNALDGIKFYQENGSFNLVHISHYGLIPT